ncbi:MAG TPA: glucose-6-phosphate dehydrogenase assembly protein OpcA [Gaiellaceae bacterium]|nr:glucose-6-phosphate dehydrogenase assembly protein OpcA [Gaiellaceae bacterium]
MSATEVQAEEWSAKDVSIGDVVSALYRLRTESAGETEGPNLRTSVMTHLAWVPPEWQEAAVETLAGLGDRHPSRGVLLFPEESATDGIDARVSVLAFPLSHHRRHIAAEVIELHLRGRTREAPASIIMPLVVTGLPVFLRWRGRPPFGEPTAEQLVDVCDRLIVDSGEWPDVPEAYRDVPFDRTACSDIAWRRTEPWRRALAGLWPGIAKAGELKAAGPIAEASLLAGWLSSRLGHKVELVHEDADQLESVSVDSEPCQLPRERLSGSDLLSAELDEFGRDPVYEAAAQAATG